MCDPYGWTRIRRHFHLMLTYAVENQKGLVTLENNSQVSPTPFYFFLLSYSVLSETGRFTDYESGQIMCYLHNVMKRLDTIPYMEYMIK